MMQKSQIFILVFSCLFLGSCKHVTSQSKKTTIMDASAEDTLGGTGTSSADIRSMAERMAREISAIDWPADMANPRIALVSIDNQTRFAINPNIIKDRLLVDLVEFSRGSNLRFSENPEGADYMLDARITALSKGSADGVSDYLLYSFKMRDKIDTLVWAGSYETKKQGAKTHVIYR